MTESELRDWICRHGESLHARGLAHGSSGNISARLADGLTHAATAAGLSHSITRVGSMMTLFFAPAPVVDWPTASHADTARYGRYFWGLIDRGVYMPCSQFEALFVSAAHSDEDIEQTIAAAAAVFQSPEFTAA